MAKIVPVMKKQCATCPFREGSEYESLMLPLALSAMIEGSRICHSTGSNAIHENTGKPDRLCRGARDVQISLFYGMGFIDAPTDEAWARKVKEMGL